MFSKKNTAVFDTSVSIKLEEIDKGHHNITYRGVECVKCPFDYVLYQMIIEEVKPDLVIEIGSYRGGSALYLADLLNMQGKGEVHTIDIQDRIDERAKNHDRIRFFYNGWEKYDLSLARSSKSVLVIEDGSHHYTDTLKAMKKFSKIISPDSYLIVEDGIINELGLSEEYGGGPVKAIKEFLSGNKDFEVSYKWTDFFGKNATFNTIGYLKRIS